MRRRESVSPGQRQMRNPQIKFTYRDYLSLPEQDRRELIEGDFYVVPAPSFGHQSIARNLGTILWDFVRINRLGVVLWAPLDVVLSEETVVQPDILFVSNGNRGIITENNVSGAPDLVIEVLSPGTAERDKGLKLRLYARAGVREYWLVDPGASSIQVMQLGPEGYNTVRTHTAGAASSPLLPGLRVVLGEVFAAY